VLLDTWNAWTDIADVDGLLNFYGLQALAARMIFIDGEVFVRFTTDAAGSLRLQLLPAEFIDTTIHQGQRHRRNRIRHGGTPHRLLHL
jgi:capsid protein